jgi:hypothetical protein
VAKVVPIQLDDGTILYIEGQSGAESPELPSRLPDRPADGEEQRRGGAKGLGSSLGGAMRIDPAQSMQMVQGTIRTYTQYCLNAFKEMSTANVDEVTLEFGVNISADAGIPYIASGKAQSNLKITVKCSFNQDEATPGANGLQGSQMNGHTAPRATVPPPPPPSYTMGN